MPSGTFAVGNSSAGMSTWVNWSTADDPGSNRSMVHVELWARRSSSTTFGSGSFAVSVDGWAQSNSGTFSIGTSNTLLVAADFYWIGHNADGGKSVTIAASGGIPGTSFSSVSGSAGATLTNYDRRPAAPSGLSLASGSLTTQSFGVNYTRNAAGTTITNDHAEWSRADTGAVVWNDYGPAGYTSPNGGLTPGAPALLAGVEYRVRVRSASSDGYGAWSGYLTQRTLSAAYVGKAGAFPPAAAVNVGKSGAFVAAAEVRVGKAGSFVNAG